MTTVRRPIFRARGERMVATQRIKIVEGTFIEPGELIPEGVRRATLRRWFLRRMIGPVGAAWTGQLLARREKLLLRDKAAKRLHPGGETELARIAGAMKGEVKPCAWKPAERKPVAIDKGAAGARKNGGATSGAGTSKTAGKRGRTKGADDAPPSLPPGATFGDGAAPPASSPGTDAPPATDAPTTGSPPPGEPTAPTAGAESTDAPPVGDVADEPLTGDAELDEMLAAETGAPAGETEPELEPMPTGDETGDVHADAEPEPKS